MTRVSIVRLIVLSSVLVATACERRPDFDIDKAHVELARAFERTPQQLAIYDDGRGVVETEWIIDFRVDGIQYPMQARFKGLKDRWELADVRMTPSGADQPAWESIGVVLGRMRGQTAELAEQTMARMKELTDFIGQYAVRHGNRFPATDIAGLKTLLIEDGTVQERNWQHDNDAWGQGVIYHAAPDGIGYILVSPGADGQFDRPQSEYFENAERGQEAYGGMSHNPAADIVVASGEMVQSFQR